MSQPPGPSAEWGRSAPPPPPAKVLRRLFLILFLRGRSARGLQKEKAPKSVGAKLALTLFFYGLFGLLALMLAGQPVFTISLYAHAMTLMFLGMFVAASAGEVLFNQEEADILLHRPVAPRALLWAKVGVLVQVSLWLGGAFNLATFCMGITSLDGGWLFPVVHAASTILAALFCTGCVVLLYQTCLRWFGRERLESFMTTAQVMLSMAMVLGSQLAPRFILQAGIKNQLTTRPWWIGLLPPAWFAGFDDALAGGASAFSWGLAGLSVVVTGTVLWLAFGRLARVYGSGLQALNEMAARPRAHGRRLWLARLVQVPPLSWWVGDSVARASFLLAAAYLMRDRDVKLRVYPGLAPMLVMPILLLVRQGGGGEVSFAVALAGSYLGFAPLLALDLLRYSQQWQAADVFRLAPIAGPASCCHGARRAVLCLIALPATGLVLLISGLLLKDLTRLALLLPGIVAIPVYAMIPCLGGRAVPLSLPTDEAKSAGRSLVVILVMVVSSALSGLAAWAWSGGWLGWLVTGEVILAAGLHFVLKRSFAGARWGSME